MELEQTLSWKGKDFSWYNGDCSECFERIQENQEKPVATDKKQ
jgi:hypothetical protein